MATSAITSVTDAAKSAVTSAVSAVTSAEPASDTPQPGGETDESPQVGDAKQKLERKLSLRPERDELVERNILKNTSVAPSLQAAQADLERARLEDKLEQKLQARPKPDELVKEGILNADEVPGA
ncbi:hypothetical protein M407DRAFT_241536 [Tulasnella calospora MUT 4182]|uniref:RPEL repeat protein n=1 Tax=Tulasnella calospora MUT 4182 TaxID=1051891 RepID=A0A0C3MEX2_9AGAM|nr:hypothetical protein M407DRAFT_241536 [Tulasnella calospora MUT 4182]